MSETPKSSVENPNIIAKQKAIGIIQQILNTTIDTDNIDEPEKYIDGVFNAFVSQVDELVRIYKEENKNELNTDEDVRNIEDKALEQAGFRNVSNTIDRILEIKEIILSSIPKIVTKYTKDIITPPDANEGIIAGSGEGFDIEKELIPRLKTLLFILLADCNLKEDQIKVTVGSVDKNMMREEPYVMVEVSDLDRTIFVCDEQGNRTDVFDMTHDMCQKEGSKGLAILTKEERNEFGRMYPGSHIAIRFSPNWSDRVYDALINPLEEKTEKSKPEKRPKTFEVLPRADKDGFYTDESGVKWCSVNMIANKISLGLYTNKKFFELLSKLPSIKILSGNMPSDAYNIEEVKMAIKNNPELSCYFRRTDENGFYTDESGVRWGSLYAIAMEISSGLKQNKDFKKILSNLHSIKILSGTKSVCAYNIEEVKAVLQKHSELSCYFRRTDENGFYTDESGVRWGSLYAIAMEISSGLKQNKDFKKILSNLHSIKILSGTKSVCAYNIEEVKAVLQKHSELSRYFRRADKDGFYIDDRGVKWCSVNMIANKISLGLYTNKKFFELLSKLPSIKILSVSQISDAYNIEEVKAVLQKHSELSCYFRRADKDGFYTDESGVRWGSATALSNEISLGLHKNKKFFELLSKLPSIKILSGKKLSNAYNIEQVKKIILNEPELNHYHDKIK